MTLFVENIKCQGCATRIHTTLSNLPGVESVEINIEHGSIFIQSQDDVRTTVLGQLKCLGYPQRGSVEGITAVQSKINAYISCALGSIQNTLKS